MINIKVLGSGCPNCLKLESLCREVIAENNIEAEIEKVTDIIDIVSYGIMSTPGLVLNDKILSTGKIPTKSTLEHLFKEADSQN
jgi:small redox-active disulfide protein 2